jgi:hypothetical protein
MSGLGWLIRDYVETREGRITWRDCLWLFLDGDLRRRKRLKYRDGRLFEERKDEVTGRTWALFKGKGAICKHVQKWLGVFPLLDPDGVRPYHIVPIKDCKSCEFHEPAKPYGRKRYARCRWFRENSGLDFPLVVLQKATVDAQRMIEGKPPL